MRHTVRGPRRTGIFVTKIDHGTAERHGPLDSAIDAGLADTFDGRGGAAEGIRDGGVQLSTVDGLLCAASAARGAGRRGGLPGR
jgi:hypothetical protein